MDCTFGCTSEAFRSFGNYLRKERELRQIPLTEISAATKIPLRSLEWIEDGDYLHFPADVFVRGFVRSYARHLGLPVDEVRQRYEDALGAHNAQPQPQPPPLEGDSTRAYGHHRFGLALFVIILLIIATITVSLLWRRGGEGDIQSSREQRVDHPARLTA